MKSKKNNIFLYVGIGFLLILVLGLCSYIVNDDIFLKENNNDFQKYDQIIEDSDEDYENINDVIVNDDDISEDNNEIANDDISVDNNQVNINILSMNEPVIIEDSSNHHLSITGDMQVSFDEDKFISVTIRGYCLGVNNEKYIVYAPASESSITIHNNDTQYRLVETINSKTGDVIYTDGSIKSSRDIDWKNVTIKSCKIENIVMVSQDENGEVVTTNTELDFEKEFK